MSYEQEENRLTEEVACILQCDADEVSEEDLDRVANNGWSVTLEGHPYCLYCGCQIAKNQDAIKGRKFCGTCRQSIRGT